MRTKLEGFGGHVFTAPHDLYWKEFDWEAAAKFWVADLHLNYHDTQVPVLGNLATWHTITLHGRVVAASWNEGIAWARCLATIFTTMSKLRRAMEDGDAI